MAAAEGAIDGIGGLTKLKRAIGKRRWTDASFCKKTVRKIMERRRRHLECRSGPGGCQVVPGGNCTKEVVPRWVTKNLKNWNKWGDEGMLFLFFSCNDNQGGYHTDCAI